MNKKAKPLRQENETRHLPVTGQNDKVLGQGDRHLYFNTNSPSIQFNTKVPQLSPEVYISEELGFDACAWLDRYVEFSHVWSPESFDDYHEACGLAILSTVAAGRVVIDFNGLSKTNLNILLIGRTSIHSKSTASNIAKDLLYEVGLDYLLAPDETTPQKLIEDMSSNTLPENFKKMNEQEQQRAICRTLTAGQRGWFVDEFGDKITAMMQTDGIMTGIKGLIRTLDGAPPKYEYRTVSRGSNLIINPYLPILGNVTIADLAPYAKNGNTLWRDGFFARFATPTPPKDFLSFGRIPNEQRAFPTSLISPLRDWDKRLGLPPYEIEESKGIQTLKCKALTPRHLKISDIVYEAHYAYHDALRWLILNSENQDLDGNYARFPEKALRIAAIFASFEGGDTIQYKHWAKAQAITERWRIGLHELYDQVTLTKQDSTTKYIKDLPVEDQVIRAIKVKKMPTAREISQFTNLKMDIITPALEKLVDEGRILRVQQVNEEKFILP